ncbi:hypothetical protein MNBD_GAMMA04-1547 [hydrothermal vent metagenome]|uniref:Uncharacterized protein n=1 Tax=hydrothermal vent metagenome TaxID=652676 RepID=A0A3B0WBZ0_9ZZZZ
MLNWTQKKHQNRFKKRALTGAMTAMMLTLFLSSQVSAEALDLTKEQYKTLGLEVAEAQKVAQYPTQVFPAQAMFHPNAIRTLSAPLSGQVSRLNVVHGAVHKGQVIMEIESPELLALQSQLLAVYSDLKVLKNELKRVSKLRQSGAASAKKLQQAQADVDKLQAEQDQQKKSLRLMGFSKKSLQRLLASQSIQSSVLSVVSPIDGQIFDLKVRLGERVTGNQMLFSLGETQPMLLKVKVPVELANRLKKGDKAEVTSIGEAVIEHIDPDVDALTQTVDVHVEVDNLERGIRPGQRFQIRFLMSSSTPASQVIYRVPSNAISQFEGETVVFVQTDDAIEPKPIKVMNIQNHQLYFLLQQESENSMDRLKVFVKGSTAIKSAFEAGEEDA